MADRSINELTQASELLDEGLTVVYQNSQTQSIAGSALKTYAQGAIASDVSAVASNTALALGYKNDAEAANTAAQMAKTGAQNAQTAIENMTVSAQNGAAAAVQKSTVGGIVNLLFTLPAGAMGTITNIAKTGTATVDGRVVDTYTVTCSDGSAFTFQITNGKDGTGTGDMAKADYDASGDVKTAGGIADYIAAALAGYVPTSRTVNSKALSTNITLSASDVSAVPTTRTINGMALSSDLTISQTFTATLTAAGWSFSSGYYTQTVSVANIKASYSVNPVVDVALLGNDATTDAARIEGFALVSLITTAAGSITAKCTGGAPTVDIPIIINVWE